MGKNVNWAYHMRPDALQLTSTEADRLLAIISKTCRIERHYEFFQLLQGEIQFFIPHQILIAAWGNFHGANLQIDITSALPGVRTPRPKGCNVDSLINVLHVRWLAQKRQPVLLESGFDPTLMHSACGCALHNALLVARSVIVHGIHDARSGSDTLYLAAGTGAVVMRGAVDRYRRLIDPLVAQVDVAFRRVAGLTNHDSAADAPPSTSSSVLSTREHEILMWIAIGRTNAEISEILDISPNTVKNHVQRIIRKLGATNRTEAVAKYRQGGRAMHINAVARSPALVTE